MSKYINAEKLIKSIKNCKDEPFTKASVYALIAQEDDSLNVKQGMWMHDSKTNMFVCSVCKNEMARNVYNWCPWCGADMF